MPFLWTILPGNLYVLTLIAPRNFCWSYWILASLHSIGDRNILRGWICARSFSSSCYWVSVDCLQCRLDMAAFTQHHKHPSLHPFFFLAMFSGPWHKGLAASSHPFLQYFLLNCCCILLVCWLIILVLFSWFGFNFPFQRALRARRAPTVCLEGGYFQSTVHIGWNSVSIEIWWQSSHLLQWEQFFISGTRTVLFFLFLWVCSADISSSLPPFFSPCSWTANGFQRTLGNVVCCKHLDGLHGGGPVPRVPC